MSTLKTVNIQHPSASVPAITLDSSGAMTGSFPSPNRNLLYNGAMQITQRATSVASITTGGYYTADRWSTNISSLGTWTQSIENDAPTGSGFRKSLKMLCTTADSSPAASDFAFIFQHLEGQDVQRIAKGTSAAQKLTLSFWVKSNTTGTYIAELADQDNNRRISFAYTINIAATWEKKTITFSEDTTGALDNDNALSFSVYFWLGSGSDYATGTLQSSWGTLNTNRAVGQINLAAATNNYWQITGVQLETGAVATPFEFKSYGQELRDCQRYYFVYLNGLVNQQYFAMGHQWSATNAEGVIFFPTVMRTAPVGSASTVSGGYRFWRGASNATANTLVFFETSNTSTGFNGAFSGTAGQPGAFDVVGSSATLITFNAEL